MTTLSILATTFGTIGAIAMLPQVIKIYKRKSAKDISLITYGFLLITAIIWVLYGIEESSFPLIISNLLGSISLLLIVIGWYFYGRTPR